MQNRKDLLRLLRDVEADKIDLILVTKLDRWFRNIKDYHNTQSILEAHHCKGEHINGKPAYGYAADENKMLIKDSATREIVEETFTYYFTTYSKLVTVKHGITDYCPAYITRNSIDCLSGLWETL